MRFRIRHTTLYRYERPVALGRHVFRFHPREDAFLTVQSFELSLYPRPLALTPVVDAEGNLTHVADFEGETHEFRVSFRAEGETYPRPLAFSSSPFLSEQGGPAGSPTSAASATSGEELSQNPSRLETYLRLDPLGAPVLDFTHDIARAAGSAPAFLEALNRKMYETLSNIPRFYGEPLNPEVTLLDGRGSCRDLAVLFIACCRHQGIPARFVSGYFPADAGDRQHMHAWAEAYLPGRGWCAYDPTQGIEAGPSHVTAAAAAEPRDATPIAGFFTGVPARSEMQVELTVEMS